LADAGVDAAKGAAGVAFEVELSFKGSKTDSMIWRSGLRATQG
jgi:hypothetical protein